MTLLAALRWLWGSRWLAAVALVLGCAVGAFVGYSAKKTKTVETKTETRVIDEAAFSRLLAQARSEWAKSTQDHTVTKTRTVYVAGKPSETTRIVYVDRDTEAHGSADSFVESVSSTARHEAQQTQTTKTTDPGRAGWRASVAAGWDPRALVLKPDVYEGRLERRLAGPFWIGAWGRTDKTAGLSAGVEW